jgi:hypothetical protein
MDDDVKPLSHLGKGSKHSSMLLSTGDLPKLRNSHDLDSAVGMKKKAGYVLMWLSSMYDINIVNCLII